VTSDEVDKARHVKSQVEAQLLQIPGVTGVGVGPKMTNGQPTDQIAIIVTVTHKTDADDVDRIPPTLSGVPTDVVELTYAPLVDPVSTDPAHHHGPQVGPSDSSDGDESLLGLAPLAGGIEIGPVGSGGGTLSYIVTDGNNYPYILSCFHVLSPTPQFAKWAEIYQPRPPIGTRPAVATNSVGYLTTTMDAGIAALTGQRPLASPMCISGLGPISAVLPYPPSYWAVLQKVGAATGLTSGLVTATDFTAIIPYYGQNVTMTGLIQCRSTNGISVAAAPGDSGAIAVDAQLRATGMIIAGSTEPNFGNYWLMAPLAAILAAFGVSLAR
jgi:hypothetical protein